MLTELDKQNHSTGKSIVWTKANETELQRGIAYLVSLNQRLPQDKRSKINLDESYGSCVELLHTGVRETLCILLLILKRVLIHHYEEIT